MPRGQARETLIVEPLDGHGLGCLGATGHAPPTLARQREYELCHGRVSVHLEFLPDMVESTRRQRKGGSPSHARAVHSGV